MIFLPTNNVSPAIKILYMNYFSCSIKYLFFVILILNLQLSYLNGINDTLASHTFDEKLEYFRFEPSIFEWEKSFGKKLAKSFGPVHLWIKCVHNSKIRGILFIDGLSISRKDDTAEYNEIDWDRNVNNFRLTLNGQLVKFTHSKMPWGLQRQSCVSIFEFDARKVESNAYVEMRINDWKRLHRMRFHKSLFNFSLPVRTVRNVAISVNFADQTNDINFFKSIEYHFNYHYGLLSFYKYHILIRDYELELLESIPFVVNQVKKGLLKIFIKPSYLPVVEGRSYRYQAIYENLMLLYHYEENTDLIVIDLDEFLIIKSENALKSLKNGKSDCLAVPRKHVSCQNCSNYYPDKEVVLNNYYSNQWKLWGNLAVNFPKLIVNPDKINCMYVHFSLCGTFCEVMYDSDLYIIHLINYMGFRTIKMMVNITFSPIDISSFVTVLAGYNNKTIITSQLNETSVPLKLQKEYDKRKDEEKKWHRNDKKLHKRKEGQDKKIAEKYCIDFNYLTMNSFRAGIAAEKIYTCPSPVEEQQICHHETSSKGIEQIKEAVLYPYDVLIITFVSKNQSINDVDNLLFWLDILNKDDEKSRLSSEIVIVGEDCATNPLGNKYDYETTNSGDCYDSTSQLLKELKDKFTSLKFLLTRVKQEHQNYKFTFASKAIINYFSMKRYYIRVDPDKVLLPMNLKNYLTTMETAGDHRYPISFGSQSDNPNTTHDGRVLYGLNNHAMRISRLGSYLEFPLLLSKRSISFVHCGGFIESRNEDIKLSVWEQSRAITIPVKKSQAKILFPILKSNHELLQRNREWFFEKEKYNPLRCAESHELSKIAINSKIDQEKVYICPLTVSSVNSKCNSSISKLLLTSPSYRSLATDDVVIYIIIDNKNSVDQIPALFWWLNLLNSENKETRLTSDIVIFGDNCPGENYSDSEYLSFESGNCEDNVYNIFETLKNNFTSIIFSVARINFDNRMNLAVKVYYASKNLYKVKPNKKIYFKIDYDTIVFPQRLQKYINTLASTTDIDTVPLYFGTTHDYLPYTLPYAQGGAGYGLNNEAMRIFENSDSPTDHIGYGSAEDFNTWKVLSLENVTLLHCAGFFSNIDNISTNGWHFHHSITFHRVKDNVWLTNNSQLLISNYKKQVKMDLNDRIDVY